MVVGLLKLKVIQINVGVSILFIVVIVGKIVVLWDFSVFFSSLCLIFKLINKKNIVIRLLLIQCEIDILKIQVCKNVWYFLFIVELVMIIVMVVVIISRMFFVDFILKKF